jgi:very-short-patch-repair endonuclease
MAERPTNSKNFANARELRNHPTASESWLWQVLRMRQFNQIRFRRQHPIGPYIVDFCAPRQKIIVELDGGQHLEQEAYDAERTAFLESKGYRVLRFWNDEVLKDRDGVLRAIEDAIGCR